MVNRPGEAPPVAQRLVIVEFVGRHQHMKFANHIEGLQGKCEPVGNFKMSVEKGRSQISAKQNLFIMQTPNEQSTLSVAGVRR